MSVRPKRPCPHPGCPVLVGHGQSRCPAHAQAQGRQDYRQDVERRGTSTQRGYGVHHRRWRAVILARDPLCCDPQGRHAGRLAPSTVADHVVPLAQGGGWSLSNGQGTCAPCHQAKTNAEAGGMRISGAAAEKPSDAPRSGLYKPGMVAE